MNRVRTGDFLALRGVLSFHPEADIQSWGGSLIPEAIGGFGNDSTCQFSEEITELIYYS